MKIFNVKTNEKETKKLFFLFFGCKKCDLRRKKN